MNSDGDCCRHSGEQARVGANEVFFAGNIGVKGGHFALRNWQMLLSNMCHDLLRR